MSQAPNVDVNASPVDADDDDILDPAQVAAPKKSRFTLTSGGERTRANGRVTLGTENSSGERFLVHAEIPRQQDQALSMGALAVALGKGVITPRQVVKCYLRANTLDSLEQALKDIKAGK